MIKAGWKRDRPDPRDFIKKYAPSRDIADLRETGFLPPVYQQYHTNACTAMAIGAAIEYMNMKEKKPVFKPSKLFIYWNARRLSNCTDKDEGAEIRDAFKSLTKWGSAPDADMPFLVEHIFQEPSSKSYEDAKKEIITQYTRISSTKHDVIAALSCGRPIVFGFEMFENLFHDEVTKSGYIPMPKGEHRGGHCMLIVGITTDSVIVRNSWGVEWGDSGYGFFPIDYLENDNLVGDTWTLDVV